MGISGRVLGVLVLQTLRVCPWLVPGNKNRQSSRETKNRIFGGEELAVFFENLVTDVNESDLDLINISNKKRQCLTVKGVLFHQQVQVEEKTVQL